MKQLLWQLDRHRLRVVWTWHGGGVECRALGADELVGHGRTGEDALREMLRQR
jgi:hypothetical protein